MRVFNSLVGRVEEFVPLREGHVSMYHCGPTVYKRQHIGNYRAYTFADFLRRTFEWLGFSVTQIINITDVGHLTVDDMADAAGEDKLEKEARARHLSPLDIARAEEEAYHADLEVLRCLPADRYPRATDHVPEMIALIEKLLASGHAYAVDGNVYFSVKSFPGYGKLSGNTLEHLEAGASGRVEARGDKRSPHDFALWKHDEKHLMQWDSPWGRGFPGWHIECSAMSMKYLGETFDIHTGGPDNKFPHHECEIAQSESATGHPFVRYWIHTGWLELAGEKMSKSKGNLFTIPQLLEMGYLGADIRFFLLRQHYRAPLPFQLDLLDAARRERERLNNFVLREMADRAEGPRNPEVAEAVRTATRRFRAALEDDLNASAALAAMHDLIREVNRAKPARADAEAAVAALRDFDRVFAVLDEPRSPGRGADEAIDALLAEREEARGRKDFARADAIRDQLAAEGIEIYDTPSGPRWRKKRG